MSTMILRKHDRSGRRIQVLLADRGPGTFWNCTACNECHYDGATFDELQAWGHHSLYCVAIKACAEDEQLLLRRMAALIYEDLVRHDYIEGPDRFESAYPSVQRDFVDVARAAKRALS